jgi:hypothetical protein
MMVGSVAGEPIVLAGPASPASVHGQRASGETRQCVSACAGVCADFLYMSAQAPLNGLSVALTALLLGLADVAHVPWFGRHHGGGGDR